MKFKQNQKDLTVYLSPSPFCILFREITNEVTSLDNKA